MGFQTRTVTLSSSVSRLTSSNETNYVTLPSPAVGGALFLNVTNLGGSSPTLVVIVQTGWQDIGNSDATINGTTTGSINWIDFVTFNQVSTSTSSQVIPIVTTLTSSQATNWQQGTMGAGSTLAGMPGDLFRIAWRVTNPLTTGASFTVVGKFIY